MQRRTVLKYLAAAPFALPGAAHIHLAHAQPRTMKDIQDLQNNWKTLLAPGTQIPDPAQKLDLKKDEWAKRLPQPAFKVLREEGTERPGTSPLDREKRPGVFACAGCGLPLFTSAMKFDSGTGWPSFFTTIPGVFGTKKDYHLIYPRTEYHCIRCGGHHGHVFDDGPPPTRLRYCNNGVALTFIPQKA
ncbi:MAG: peptide-methionine (R)-S-oxide reductase MsrB [Betaproteobacteria bacterium]|nr:peptide-methionine (R)-S-oxide reductase MsrB [Betaproteobacteria bacterium]